MNTSNLSDHGDYEQNKENNKWMMIKMKDENENKKNDKWNKQPQ